jgi:hypothetical protein
MTGNGASVGGADTAAGGGGGGYTSAFTGATSTTAPVAWVAGAHSKGDLVTFDSGDGTGSHVYRATANVTKPLEDPKTDSPEWVNADGESKTNSAIGGNLPQSDLNTAGSHVGNSVASNAINSVPTAGTTATVDGTVHAGGHVHVWATDNLHVFSVAGTAVAGAVGVGASIDVLNVDSSTDAGIGGTGSVSATSGEVNVQANMDEKSTGIAFGGSAGLVAVGAQVAVLNDSGSQDAHIDSFADVPQAGAGLTVATTAHRDVNAYAIGIGLGAAAAGAAVGVVNVTGDAKARIENVSVGGTAPLGGLTVSVTDNITSDLHVISVQGGVGIGLGAAVAFDNLQGTAKASSGAHGSVGAGGMSVTATGTHTATVSTFNVATGGLAAIGITVARVDNARSTEALFTSDGNITFTSAAPATVQATATNSADVEVPGGGGGALQVAVMLGFAILNGHTTAEADGTVSNATDILVSSIADNTATSNSIVVGLGVIGLNGAVTTATIDTGAYIETTVGKNASLGGSGTITVEAKTRNGGNVATSSATGGTLGVLAAGTIFVAISTINAHVEAHLNGAVPSGSSLDVNANAVNHAHAVTDATSISLGGALSGAFSLSTISSTADVTADAAKTASIGVSGASTIEATSMDTSDGTANVGSGGLLAIGVSIPTAVVAAPTGAAYDGSVTGGAGFTVKATSTNTAHVDSVPISVGVFAGAGAATHAEVTDSAQTTAGVGKDAKLDIHGSVALVKTKTTDSATSKVDMLTLSLAFSAGVVSAQSFDRGGSHASFDGELVSASQLNVEADASRAANATLFAASFSVGIGFSAADATAKIGDTGNAEDLASIDGDAYIHSAGTAITVKATRGATVAAKATGGAGAILGAGAFMEAISSVTGAVKAYVASGATVGDNTGKPGGIQVNAADTAIASSYTVVGSGALGFSAGETLSDATSSPEVDAYVDGGVHVTLGDGISSNLAIQAKLNDTEAGATAKSFGGALGLHVGAPDAKATSLPKVHAYIGTGTTVKAGGSVSVDAESLTNGPGTAPTPFITGMTADCGCSTDPADDSVTFLAHGLITGDQVKFEGSIGGLTNGHTYGVIVVDQNTLRFGATFNATTTVDADSLAGSITGLDLNRAMVRFAAPHNLITGDALIYRVGPSGSSISADFVDGQVLYVRVIDANDIELYTSLSDATAPVFAFNTTSAYISGSEIIDGGTFSDGQRVTYQTAPPLTFDAKAVNIDSDGSGGISNPSDSGAHDIFLAFHNPEQGGPEFGHGFNTGQAVIYQVSNPSSNIPELTDGGTYYVIVVDAWTIQLAATYCDSVDNAIDGSCPNLAPNPILISRPSDNAATQGIRPAPLGGLTDGFTYQVARQGDGNITLRKVGSSSDIAISAVDSSGGSILGDVNGNQSLFIAGSALQVGAGKQQQLYERLTGTLPNAFQQLLAPDGTSLRQSSPPSGVGQTGASAIGGGGAAIDVSEPTATVTVGPLVKSYIAGSVDAGGDVKITSQLATNSTANTENGSGGLVSIPSTSSNISGTDNNSTFIGANFLGDGIGGDTPGSAQVDGGGITIKAGGNILLQPRTFLKSSIRSKSDSGGGFDDSSASSVTSFTDNTSAVIGKNAHVTGSTVALDASSGGNNSGDASSFVLALFGGSSDTSKFTLNGNDTALLDGDSTSTGAVTGINGVDVRAHHDNNNQGFSGSYTCICFDFHVGNSHETHANLSDTASGHEGMTVTAGPRILEGVNTNDPALKTPLFDTTGDNSLALFVQANFTTVGGATNADSAHRIVHWNSDVIVYSGPQPLLVIAPDGTVATAVNITANGVHNPAPGDALVANTFVEVNDIVNHDTGDVWMEGSEAIDGGQMISTHYWGTFTFRQNYNTVTVINNSTGVHTRQLQLDNMTVINLNAQPQVTLNSSGVSINVDLEQNAFPTLITLTNNTTSEMLFNGTIDNPIGDTEVTNTGGNISAATDRTGASLIRSNILHIVAPAGNVGSAVGNFLNVDLVQWDGAAMVFTATAGLDVNLDMRTSARDTGIVYPPSSTTVDGRNQDVSSGTLTLASTSGFGASGAFTAGGVTGQCTYSTKDGTHFYGIGGCSGVPADDATVTNADFITVGHIVGGDNVNIRLRPTQDAVGTQGLPGISFIVNAGTPATYYNQYSTESLPIENFDPGAVGGGPNAMISTYNFTLIDAGSAVATGSIDVFNADDSAGSTHVNVIGLVQVENSGNVNGDINGFFTLNEQSGDMRVGTIKSTDDDVTLNAPGAIYDAPVGAANPPLSGDGTTDVIGVSVNLTALSGSIGQDINFLEIQSSVDRFGVLNATAPGVIRITQTTGDLHVDTVTTCFNNGGACNDVSLTNSNGSITDGHLDGAGDTIPNVIGNTIDLLATNGSIGIPTALATNIQDLKVYSSVGPSCTRHVTLAYQDANYQNATGTERAVTAVCHLAAQADNSVFITETPGALAVAAPMDLLLALARNGNVRLTTTETGVDGNGVAGSNASASAGNDILLLNSGSTLVVENSPQTVPFGLVKAQNGNVKLVSADDIVTDPNAQILATTKLGDPGTGNTTDPNQPANQTGNIDIYGDSHPAGADPNSSNGDGAVIVLRGIVTPGTGGLTRVFGNAEADTIIFDETFLGGETRAYGDSVATALNALAAPCGGGTQCNDTFIVNRLMTMIPVGALIDGSLGSSLTLDGQSGSNVYTIYTSGSQFGSNNYMINVLGSHSPSDGSDTLNVYGYDTYTAGLPDRTGINPIGSVDYSTNDIFLLRSVPYIPGRFTGGETSARPSIYEGAGQTAATAHEGFIAVLHSPLLATEAVDSTGALTNGGTAGTFGVERVNYDSSLNGGVHVYSLGGNDYFAVDDNAAPTYLDGGQGDNSFQIGQIFGLRRNAMPVTSTPPPPTFNGSGNLAAENVFDVATVATTRGWLSRGTSSPLVAQGGTGNNIFTVYSNHAVLHLEGDGGNNLFIVRGFALAQTDTNGNLILPGGCATVAAPYCLPIPITTNGFSTAAETDVRTGAGSNQVEYNMNAPVSVDGGTGFNKLIILGTEFADHIVVTDHGIFGAGMFVTFRNIQVIEINALEGDDTIDVLSTPPGVAVRVIGGLGSNQINVAGDVNGNVYSQDINGTSATINHAVLTNDQLYRDLVIPGVSLSVAQGSQGAVIITEHAGGTVVSENTGTPGSIGTIDTYNVRLAQAPTGTVYVSVTAEPDILLNRTGTPQGDSILLATGTNPAIGTNPSNSDFYQHTIVDMVNPTNIARRAVVLVFDATNWQIPQIVDVGAINDALNDGVRVYEVSHSVLSSDSFFDGAAVRNVEVTKIDPGTPSILLTNLGNTNTPGVYFDGVANGTTTFTSPTATFVSTDLNQALVEIDGAGHVVGGTTIITVNSATSVTLSVAASAATAIKFSLPSRVTPPANFNDGATSGTNTFTSAANFTLSDLGQPILETDGAGRIAATAVITAVMNRTTVTISPNIVTAGSGIGFVLPSRLAAFAFFRDGATTGGTNTITSASAAFNAGDVGRPIMESDAGGHLAPGTVILSVSSDARTATISANTLGVGSFTGIVFALPARNANNQVLEGDAVSGIVDYYSVTLGAQPSAPVTVTIAPADGYAVLSSTDSRFSTVTAQLGSAAGVYQLIFSTTDYSKPVVIQVAAANLFSPFDPHNEFVAHTATAGAAEYVNNPPTAPSVSATPMFFQIYSNHVPNGIVQAPSGMVVTKCGDTACTFPGPGSSYTLRLAMAPTLPVTVGLISDGQTDVTPGGGVANTAIGAPTPVAMFQGNITIAGMVISRGAGSELGSFINEGFQTGQLVSISGLAGTFTVATATAATITLTSAPAAGSYSAVTINRIVNHGLFTGLVNYNDCAAMVAGHCQGTLTRADGSSWLDDGFLEGQMFQINGVGPLYKIQALAGTVSTKVDILVVTTAVHDPSTDAESVAKLPFAGMGSTTATLRQWGAQTTFTAANWFVPEAIPVLADPYYNVPSSNASLLEFPKVPHLLSSIRGPLSVEGADPGNDHTQLQMAVMLPHETDALPFGIGVQPPESQQVNVLNIFDDGSQQDQTGTLSSTALTGFGMGPGLDFTGHKGYVPGDPRHPTFGEPAKFPGGISFGSITIDPATGNFLTNASLSTVQVLNLMMGQGNDHLAVTGSLVPGVYANPDGSTTTTVNGLAVPNTFIHGGLTQVQGGGAAFLAVNNGTFDIVGGATTWTIDREDALNWGDYEFAVGQELLWNGQPFGMITGITGDALTVVGQPPVTGIGQTGTIAVFDPAIKSASSFTLAGHTITRNDFRSWAEFGFAVGQSVAVDGVPAGTITSLSGPTNDILTVSGTLPAAGGTVAAYDPLNPNAVRLGGNDITVTGGGGPGPGLTVPAVIASASLTLTAVTAGTSTETLTRSAGSWIKDGFVYGMVLQIAGVPAWTITGVSDTTLDLTGPNTMPPSLASATLYGFAPSPLVIYGSTSQDGIWYSGDPHTLTQRDFGSKPFPTQLGNGTPDFIFPVADPFKYAGNNVIDASADFPVAPLSTTSVPNVGVPEGQVPSVGVVIYTGPGSNTVYGSQAPDFIAGGSGDNTIYGERGANQLLGSDGMNVDVITRAISFPTANVSVYPNADLLLCGQTPRPTCNNTIYGNTPGAGEVTTDRFADYNNVIFGAMGIVTQDTAEATVGVLGGVLGARTVTGLTLVSNVSTGNATLTCPSSTACFLPGDVGQLVSDSYGFLGAGTTITMVTVVGGVTVATLSRNALNAATATGLTVNVFATRTVTARLTANAASIQNSIPPGTASLVATLTCATSCFTQSDVGLTVSDAGNTNLSAGTVIVAVNAGGTVATLSRNAVTGTVSGLAVVVGPPHGYCRPFGAVSNSQYCNPSALTAFGDARVEKLLTTGDILTIASTRPQNHGNDTLYGSGGDNVIVGGDGTNNIQGGPGRDLIIGGSALLDRNNSHLYNYTNLRFQDLSGTQMYSNATGTAVPLGAALNDGKPQLDPTGRGWWGDFLITLSAPLGDPLRGNDLRDSAYKGADYIAGGPGTSMIFGESNNNIIQAHGSIDITDSTALQGSNGSPSINTVFAGAATCPFAGFFLGNRVGACRAPDNTLLINPSGDNYAPLEYTVSGTFTFGSNTITRTGPYTWTDFGFAVGQTITVNGAVAGVISAITDTTLTITGVLSAGSTLATIVATDGESYVEGGRGNNTIFANQGQNDIVGGNSDMFSLTLPSERASGSNLIFGGSGDHSARGDCGQGTINGSNTCVVSQNGHAHDANVIVANNGDIVRLVGTNGHFGQATGDVAMSIGLLNFNYDVQGYTAASERIIARVVTGCATAAAACSSMSSGPLDYTPGGPDLAGQNPGPQVTGAKATNGVGDIGGTPETVNGVSLMKGSEIHAESGDAFIYGGPANDTIYGGGQNDTIILGYADNWASGGYGDACIIGGGGRCFISRNGFSEPLYGVKAIPQGQLSQLITTPGNAQQATINIQGALDYVALLYPYNVDPTTYASPGQTNNDPTFSTGCKGDPAKPCPHYQPMFGHNVIYGGWGGGVIHGGPGQSALSGAEAPEIGFANNYNLNGDQLNSAAFGFSATPWETDWYHPFNPGNPMGWVPQTATLHGNANRATLMGKAAYFDTENVRIKTMLNADGSNCIWATGDWTQCTYNWFLNFNPTETGLPLDTKWYPGTGLPQNPTTGDKAIFGDLGNDWIVAGMCRCRVYGGWGNDVIDLRASMDVNGGLNNSPVLNPNGTPGTPAWEALAFGGGGQDILFAGTAGDRLIDWTGNHNSYFVPFGPFGMPTVSRTLMPALPRFLYALSQSDGADLTLGSRYGGDPARNGEPFGELGLVLQHDAAWHNTHGPPFNEMPENLGGTAIDIHKTANIRPMQSPGTDPPGDFPTPVLSLPLSVDTVMAPATPISITGPAGASVAYDITDGVKHVTGGGVVGSGGTFATSVDVSGLADGTLTGTATVTLGAGVSTVTNYMGKASTLPTAPTVSVPTWANLVNESALELTITGAPNTIVDFTVTDGNDINGSEDVIGLTGVVYEYIDVTWLADGLLTASATLTNAVGNSSAGTATLTKDTVVPYMSALGVPTPYLTTSTMKSGYLTVEGESRSTVQWTIADGTHFLSGSHVLNASGQWNNTGASWSSMNDGPVTTTVTETDPEGNPNTVVYNQIKETTTGGSFSVAGTTINGTVATTNPNLSLTLALTAPSGIATVAFSTNGGSTYGATQAYSTAASLALPATDGLYTIAIRATTNAGTVSTYTKQVRLDRTGPTISYSITTPTNSGSYDVGQAVTLTYSGSDPDNVASISAAIDGSTSNLASGVAFNTEMLAPGVHSIVITAKDSFGNVSKTTISISVHATVTGLKAAVSDGLNSGKITSTSVSSSLQSYLTNALNALNAGNHTSAKTYLGSFINLVQGQSGVSISTAYAPLLIAWANDLIGRL